MSTIQVHEVCKVRNAAVGRAGNGYSLAVFKKATCFHKQHAYPSLPSLSLPRSHSGADSPSDLCIRAAPWVPL